MNIDEKLDHFPEAWRPVPGDKLVGRVVELDELESKFGGSYPLITVETDAGEQFAVHAFHSVLKNELARLKPKVGDELGIKYLGRDDRVSYERYRVVLESETPKLGLDWDRVGADARAELSDLPYYEDIPIEEPSS